VRSLETSTSRYVVSLLHENLGSTVYPDDSWYTVALYPEGYVVCLNFELTHPQTERSTALGWFLSGTLIGPALGEYLPST
jgi:hypothetical protein